MNLEHDNPILNLDVGATHGFDSGSTGGGRKVATPQGKVPGNGGDAGSRVRKTQTTPVKVTPVKSPVPKKHKPADEDEEIPATQPRNLDFSESAAPDQAAKEGPMDVEATRFKPWFA